MIFIQTSNFTSFFANRIISINLETELTQINNCNFLSKTSQKNLLIHVLEG